MDKMKKARLRAWRYRVGSLRGVRFGMSIVASVPTLPERVVNAPAKLLYGLGLRSASRLTLPDFLGIGAAKSGTTWLHSNLSCHPDLFLPAEKELHYFDWRFHKSLGFYSNKFREGAGKKKGEITPGYSILPLSRIRFIRRIMPDVRLIFLVRDPVERAWSHLLHYFLRVKGRTYEDVANWEIEANLEANWTFVRGGYSRILQDWLSVFPGEQLLIQRFEAVEKQPQAVLTRVFAHIGVTTNVDWTRFAYNEKVLEGLGDKIPDKYQKLIENMYALEIAWLSKIPPEGSRGDHV